MLGNRMKEIRLAYKMSQAELAALVGVAENEIQSFEENESSPSVLELRKIAEALSCSADYLLGLTEAEPIRISTEGLSEPQIRQMQELVDLFSTRETDAGRCRPDVAAD